MKFILASTLAASAFACYFEDTVAECNAYSRDTCTDQCPEYKTETSCPTGCEWKEQNSFMATVFSCARDETATTCDGIYDAISCEAIENCAYVTSTCDWGPSCTFMSPCSGLDEAPCNTNQYCEYSNGFCSTDFMAMPSCGDDACDDGCTSTQECMNHEVCGSSTLSTCVAEEGCFWTEAAGTMNVEASVFGMTQTEVQPAQSSCGPCFTDPSKTESSYKWAKATAPAGCSIYANIESSMVSAEMSGSVDLLSATAHASCESTTAVAASGVFGTGADDLTAIDPDAVFIVDCSYGVGDAPFGSSAVVAVPALLVAAMSFLL